MCCRCRRTEDREQRTESRGQKTEDREQRTENRGQRAENIGQKTGEFEVGRRGSENPGRCWVKGFRCQPSRGLKSGQSDRKRIVIKRRLKLGKNRNGFSSLEENWTGSTRSSG